MRLKHTTAQWRLSVNSFVTDQELHPGPLLVAVVEAVRALPGIDCPLLVHLLRKRRSRYTFLSPSINLALPLWRSSMPSEALLRRVVGEYHEMPGLRLTFAQACRLWQLDAATCEAVIGRLVQQRVLHQTRDGQYIAFPAPRPAKAALTR